MVTKHFQKELEERVSNLISDVENSCKICGDNYRYKSHLLLHLGCKERVKNENEIVDLVLNCKSSNYKSNRLLPVDNAFASIILNFIFDPSQSMA